MNINPGPLSRDVLFMYNNHRALDVFVNPQNHREAFKIKRGDRCLWNHLSENPVGDRVKNIISEAGFGGILDCGYRYVDRALITAMVERWRPETHTFHLPVGETTITLQDVNVLWGLPVEGSVVSGTETRWTTEEVVSTCQTLFGFTPEDGDFRGYTIFSTSILREIKKSFSENQATNEECEIRARLIMFYIIGCTLFPDNSNERISMHFIPFLVNIRSCGQLSWGSVALACLYRNMYKASAPAAKTITGLVFILQIWVWERIRCLSPDPRDNNFDFSMPLTARWQKGKLCFSDNPSHCLRSYRSQLQSLNDAMFNWTPYRGVIDRLPGICRSGSGSWRSSCPMIFLAIVEHHYPERVMRQFGMVQHIPPPIQITQSDHESLHQITRLGRAGTDWKNKLSRFVKAWDRRQRRVVNDEQINYHDVGPDYMSWYMPRTVVYISNPSLPPVPMHGFQDDGARVQLMAETMGMIYRSSGQDDRHDPRVSNQGIHDTAYRAMEISNQQDYLQYPTHWTTSPLDMSIPARPRRVGRVRAPLNPNFGGEGSPDISIGSDFEFGRNNEEGQNAEIPDGAFSLQNVDDVRFGSNFEVGGGSNVVRNTQDGPSGGTAEHGASIVLNDMLGELLTSDNMETNPNFWSNMYHYMGQQTSQPDYTTPQNQIMSFRPDEHSNYNYHAPTQIDIPQPPRYANVQAVGGLNLNLSLNNETQEPPPFETQSQQPLRAPSDRPRQPPSWLDGYHYNG